MSREESFYHRIGQPRSFESRVQGAAQRALNIANARAASISLVAEPPTTSESISRNQLKRLAKWATLGVPVIPLLLMACSAPASSSVAVEQKAVPTATATPEACDPDKFAKEQGIPTPVAVGGERDGRLTQIMAIREKINNCQKLTPEEIKALVDFNQEQLVLGEVPTPEPPPSSAKPTATATEAPVKPTPTEVKKDAPCGILPQEYCGRAEIFDYTKDGRTYKLVGFQEGNLPAETPLFSPVKGKTSWQDARTEEKYTNPFQRVSSVSVMDNNDPKQTRYAFFGGLQTVMPSGTSSADVKEGEVIARVKPGEKIFGYGMAILITQIDGGKEETPEGLIKELLPGAYSKSSSK